MDITQRLILLDPTLTQRNEGHWQEAYNPDLPGFSSFNDAGIECETGEFLYALTRLLKPQRILETGTHWGIGASYMGMALKDNKKGVLDTIEFLPEIHKEAEARIARLGLQDTVLTHLGDARQFNPGERRYGLILLDTEPQTRFEELVRFFPSLEDGGFVFIHDLHQHMHQIPNAEHGFAWPFGRIPHSMQELVIKGQLRPMHFPTPRGLTGFYKVHPNDYKWNGDY